MPLLPCLLAESLLVPALAWVSPLARPRLEACPAHRTLICSCLHGATLLRMRHLACYGKWRLHTWRELSFLVLVVPWSFELTHIVPFALFVTVFALLGIISNCRAFVVHYSLIFGSPGLPCCSLPLRSSRVPRLAAMAPCRLSPPSRVLGMVPLVSPSPSAVRC